MRRRRMIMAATVGLVLPAATLAQDVLKPSPVAVSLPWKINCHGLAAVAMTSDAMQTLPVQLVAMLNCGEGIAVLSDAEGYTVHVRTADGRTGYVASPYVVKAPPPKPTSHVEPTSAATNNGVAHWRPGAKGCDQFNKDGAVVESLTANGVTVQVSLQNTGSKLRANLAIGNFSSLHVYVDPVGITLQSAGAHAKSLANRDPRQLAKQTQGSGSNAVNTSSQEAEFTPVFAAVYAAQRQPVEDLSRPQVASVADAFSALALKKGSVRPNGRTWGAVWFDRDENPGTYVMRVPIDNQVFEFPLSLNPSLSLNQ
jgi:uncharacterized MAPEG superfamily protein